jgi:hypothetical protein
MVPSTQTTFERREGETPTAPHPSVVGKAKVMSYEDIVEAQANRYAVLFYKFSDTSIFIGHFDEAERSAYFCCKLSQPLNLILIIQHSNIGIWLL